MRDGIEIKFDAKELETILDNAFEDVEKGTEKAARETAQEAVAALKATSPKRPGGGQYAAGWDYEPAPGVDEGFVVWNPKHYMLTHLLEKGHQKYNQWGGPWKGGSRTKAIRHIRPVEEAEIPKFLKRIQDIKFR